MVTKRRKRSTKKVKSLKAKSLTTKQAKDVKGGVVLQGGSYYEKVGSDH